MTLTPSHIPVEWNPQSRYHRSIVEAIVTNGGEGPKYSIGQYVCFSFPHMTGVKIGQGIILGVNLHPDWDNHAHEWVGYHWAYKVDVFDTGLESIPTGITTLAESEIFPVSVVSPPDSVDIVGLIPSPAWLFGRMHLLEQKAHELIGEEYQIQIRLPFYEP